MYYKIGTLEQLELVKEKFTAEVYNKIYEIVAMLDREYSPTRIIDKADGGFCLFVDSNESLAEVIKVIDINKNLPEWVEPIGTEYLNALYLRHNEFGISLLISKDIAPQKLLDELGRDIE